MTLLKLDIERDDTAVRIALQGELDIASANQLGPELEEAHRAGAELVVLDLRRLTFMDSTGLRLVVRADEDAQERGGRLVVVRGPEPVDRVFRLVGLDSRLEFADEPPPART